MCGLSREARVKGFEREGRSLGDERRDGRPRVRGEREREARRAEKRTFDRKWTNIDRWKSRACRSSFGFIGGETVPSVSGGVDRGGGPDRISGMGAARRWLVLFRWANRTNGPDLAERHNLRRPAAPRVTMASSRAWREIWVRPEVRVASARGNARAASVATPTPRRTLNFPNPHLSRWLDAREPGGIGPPDTRAHPIPLSPERRSTPSGRPSAALCLCAPSSAPDRSPPPPASGASPPPRVPPHTRSQIFRPDRRGPPRAPEASEPRAPNDHARVDSTPDATAHGAPRPGARHPGSRAHPMPFPSEARLTPDPPQPPRKPAASGRTAAPRASTRARRASRRASSGGSTPSESSCAPSDLRFSPASTIPCPSNKRATRSREVIKERADRRAAATTPRTSTRAVRFHVMYFYISIEAERHREVPYSWCCVDGRGLASETRRRKYLILVAAIEFSSNSPTDVSVGAPLRVARLHVVDRVRFGTCAPVAPRRHASPRALGPASRDAALPTDRLWALARSVPTASRRRVARYPPSPPR